MANGREKKDESKPLGKTRRHPMGSQQRAILERVHVSATIFFDFAHIPRRRSGATAVSDSGGRQVL